MRLGSHGFYVEVMRRHGGHELIALDEHQRPPEIAFEQEAAFVEGMQQLLAPWTNGSTLLQGAAMAALIGVGVGIYAISLQLLRLPEFTLLTGKVAQRFRKS